MPLTSQAPPRPQQSLEVLTAPTATDLLLVETVRARFGLGTDDATLTKLAEIVTDASGKVAEFLRYDPAYSPAVQESFWNLRGANLYVSKRPLLTVAQVLDSTDTALATTNYAVDRTAHSVLRPGGWQTWGSSSPLGHLSLVNGTENVPDWRVMYSAGWWLETMSGSKPASVPTMDSRVRSGFLAICRWLWLRESGVQDSGVKQMTQEGATVIVKDSRPEDFDRETGLPLVCVSGMHSLRRVA